jgi:hypothetical protein
LFENILLQNQKRTKKYDSSENSTHEMEKETVDAGHMDEPNDVSFCSDDYKIKSSNL